MAGESFAPAGSEINPPQIGGSGSSAAAPVASVFSRTGIVVAASGDYTQSQITSVANSIAVANLAAGLAGQVIQGTTPSYAYPPGYEIDYVQVTSPVNVTATTEGTANTLITGTSLAYSATTNLIEFWTPGFTDNSNDVSVVILRGATVLGQSFQSTANNQTVPYPIIVRDTPSASTFAYVVKAFTGSGTQTMQAGSGGSGNRFPAFLRVTKV